MFRFDPMVKYYQRYSVFQFLFLGIIICGSLLNTGCGSFKQAPIHQNLKVGIGSPIAKVKVIHSGNSEVVKPADLMGLAEKCDGKGVAILVNPMGEKALGGVLVKKRGDAKSLDFSAKKIVLPSDTSVRKFTKNNIVLTDSARLALGRRKAIYGIILTVISAAGTPLFIPVFFSPFALAYCLRALKLLKKGERGWRWAKLGKVLGVIYISLMLLVLIIILPYILSWLLYL